MNDFDITIQSDEFDPTLRPSDVLTPDELDDYYGNERDENGWTDMDYDSDTLASAGYGTDEDYGYFGGGDDW